MDAFWAEWASLTDLSKAAPILMRLTVTALFGGWIGWERERGGHTAGLRTHMLVGLGAAVFTLIAVLPVDEPDLANIIKGVAAGVGFLGGGAILKNVQGQAVEGLTTAAAIWITAAIGVAAGAGMYLTAFVATVIALLVLRPLRAVEQEHRGLSDDKS
jgi:putative Mg2+ transporter-C (MgtC) family protein